MKRRQVSGHAGEMWELSTGVINIPEEFKGVWITTKGMPDRRFKRGRQMYSYFMRHEVSHQTAWRAKALKADLDRYSGSV